MASVLDCFKEKKPVIGVIHAKGDSDADVLRRAKEEIKIYLENGVSGVLVETYFGVYPQVEKILGYLQDAKFDAPYGVNCLNVDAMGFDLATRFGCSFLQIDSVVGHVKPRDEPTLDAFFAKFRSECPAWLMGGVRFKYQPVLSKNTLSEDLLIGMSRCDAVCVTEDATGQETSMDKINRFKAITGDFPLIVCAGVTPENAVAQLSIADAAVVGSYFKEGHKDVGDVCAENVRALMAEVAKLR